MDVINNIHDKLHPTGRFGFRSWKHRKGDISEHLKELTEDEKKFIKSSSPSGSLCSMVIEHGSRGLPATIYKYIYNKIDGASAVNHCRKKLYPPDDDDDSDEEEAAGFANRQHSNNMAAQRAKKAKQVAFRSALVEGGRRRRRRKSRRKKKSRKSKRRKGLNSKKRRRRKRRTKKR